MTLPPTVVFLHRCRHLWYTLALWLLLGGLHSEAKTLEQALELRDSGRGYQALEILNALRKADPESPRIKLETALVWIQLKQYPKAIPLLEDVLSEPDLPPNVRINTQLLLLKTRQLQKERRDAAVSLGLIAGISHHSRFEQTLADSSATIKLNHPLTPLNMAGYPVMLDWINTGVLGLIHEPVIQQSSVLVDLSTQLNLRLNDFWLRPGLDLQLSENGTEPGGNLAGGWRPGPSFSTSGSFERRWQADGDAQYRRWVKLNLFDRRALQLELHFLNRAEESGDQWLTSNRLGASIVLGSIQHWSLGGDWALGDPGAYTEWEIFIVGKRPLPHGFALTTDLRYLEFSDDSQGGFARLGLLWQK